MKKEIYLKVHTDPMTDFEDLAIKLNELKDYEFFQYFPEDGMGIEEQKEWLLKVGQTEAFYTQEYYEALGTTSHRPSDIKDLIQKYLDRIVTTNKLLIVDRFIFPTNHDSTYATFVGDILDKYIATLDEITFVTSPSHNRTIKSSIETLLKSKKSTLNISYKFSDEFHDRFWISDHNDKGLFLGTSLNGYGRKYALIDYINTSDVRQIISELREQGLL